MKIWKLMVDYGENGCLERFSLNDENMDIFKRLKFASTFCSGEILTDKIGNIELRKDEGRCKSDHPKFNTCSGMVLFSERAKKCVEELLNGYVEFVPATVVDDMESKYYILNILAIRDVIDYDKATFEMLDGEILAREKDAFIYEKVKDLPMFRTMFPDRVNEIDVYVSSKFKELVEVNGLVGFKFIEVWDSDESM